MKRVVGHCVTCGRDLVASDQKFAGEYRGWCATCRWESIERKETMPTNNGVSDESARAQIAVSAAQTAREQSDTAGAECAALVATFDDALARLLEIGKGLLPVLHMRRQAYWKAVSAARVLAKLTGQPSTEDDIRIVPFRVDVRRLLPSGVVTDVQLWPESSLVLPSEVEPENNLVPLPQYVDAGASPRPLRTGRS